MAATASRYCLGNTAKHRYRIRTKPAVEIFYLSCSNGLMQRFNAEGLALFDQACARDSMTYTIVDPVRKNIRDEIMLSPVYEG